MESIKLIDPMHTLFHAKKRFGITLVEIMIAMSIFCVVGTMVASWFNSNAKYNKRLTEQNDGDDRLRKCLWTMHQDFKTARTILYPTLSKVSEDPKENIISDSKIVVRNFDGDVIAYNLDAKNKTIIRTALYMPAGNPPENETKVIAEKIDTVVFTNRNEMNNTVGIYMESGSSCILDSVFLMNE